MQRKRILVACISLLLVGLALPTTSIPKAHAFFAGNIGVTLGNVFRDFSDPNGNTVDAAQAGSTLTVTVTLQASNFQPPYQRNVTMGFKGDWMSQYQNATSASQTTTLPLANNQVGSAQISVTLPSTGGTSPTHTWTVAVWDGALNTLNGADCSAGRREKIASCETISNAGAGYNRLAIYTSDQYSGAQADVQAATIIGNVQTAIATIAGPLHTSPPGVTAAEGQLAQAQTELSLGGQSWRNGDYGGAKTHYQNALNDANAAASSLTNQGGGVDNATLVNLLLGGTGIALIGVGALLAGLGGFFYLRRKPKA